MIPKFIYIGFFATFIFVIGGFVLLSDNKKVDDSNVVASTTPIASVVTTPSSVASTSSSDSNDNSNSCVRAGCSSQLCVDKRDAGNIMTTCVYDERYACYENVRCEKQGDGRCGFTLTTEAKACLNSLSSTETQVPTAGQPPAVAPISVSPPAADSKPTPTPVVVPISQIIKPKGIFSSSGAGSTGVLSDPEVRGVLIRGFWKDIEKTPDVFTFTVIDQQVAMVKNTGKSYSLSIMAGGPGSPLWLTDTLGAPYINYSFRGETASRLPLFWDEIAQERLNKLAKALGEKYGNDPLLKLVYVSQMSANGLEGHLQNVDMTALKKAGYTDDKWVEAGKQVARNFASAFPNKALAFEVHDVNGGSSVPSRIINDLWSDPSLGQRVGAGMWWISGKTSYQGELIEVLKAYPGDIYGQVIGKSTEPTRFQNGDYATVFSQAKDIGMRYVEPWEYEFKPGPNGADGKWDEIFKDFNTWADTLP